MIIGKLGKKPAVYDPRTLKVGNYLHPVRLPFPPPDSRWSAEVDEWPMYRNDLIGDCALAGPAHAIQAWTANVGMESAPTDADVIAAYSAISGYDPETGANDDGCVMLEVMRYWRQIGIGGHKILAFASIEPRNTTELRDAIWLFGGVIAGVSLPLAAQQPGIWALPWGGLDGDNEPGSWGGHCIHLIDATPRGAMCVTWGALQFCSWAWLETYMDEGFVAISPDWVTRHRPAPNLVNLDTLLADARALAAPTH